MKINSVVKIDLMRSKAKWKNKIEKNVDVYNLGKSQVNEQLITGINSKKVDNLRWREREGVNGRIDELLI